MNGARFVHDRLELAGWQVEIADAQKVKGLAPLARGAETAQTAGFVLLFPLVFASSVFVPVSTLPNWLQPIAKASPVTLTADAARTLALTGGVPDSLGGALAWIVGIVAVFVPLSVWRYRRMS
jgi:ABC-type multidrug transport system permease subunit